MKFLHLTLWGRVTHICVSKPTIIGSDNGLLPGRHQYIIWTNDGTLLIRTLGTSFSEIVSEIRIFSFRKMKCTWIIVWKMVAISSRVQCVKLNFTLKFNVNHSPTLNQGVLRLWCKFGNPILNVWRVMAQTSSVLTHRHTDTPTHIWTDTGNDKPRTPKLASVKTLQSLPIQYQSTTIHLHNICPNP